jgi:hypothetical protein
MPRGKACRNARGRVRTTCRSAVAGCCAAVLHGVLASGALAAEPPDAERGRHLLTHYQCGSCHQIPGVAGAAGRSAPTLAAFGRRSVAAGVAA